MDQTKFASGAVRGAEQAKVRYDLISHIGLRRLAETCHEGAVRHLPRNWEQGIPTVDLLNHAFDHLLGYCNGDRSEDHLAHATWNLVAAMDNEERRPAMMEGILCQTAAKPDLDTSAASKLPSL